MRRRVDADLSALAVILAEVHARDGYPVEGIADPEGWLSSPDLLGAWVAAGPDGAVTGHVMVVARPSLSGGPAGAPVLERLFVGPAGRGTGAGRALLTAAVDAVPGPLVLEVLDKDTAAIRLYRSLGWTPFGSLEHRFGGRTYPVTGFVSPARFLPPAG